MKMKIIILRKFHFCGNASLNFKAHFQGDSTKLHKKVLKYFLSKYKKEKIFSHSNRVIERKYKKGARSPTAIIQGIMDPFIIFF